MFSINTCFQDWQATLKLEVKQTSSVSTINSVISTQCCTTYNPSYSKHSLLPVCNIHFSTCPGGNTQIVSSQPADTTQQITQVYIFQCNAYKNCLPDASEFYLVFPDYCICFFCFLPLPLSYSYFSLLFWLIPQLLYAIQKQMVTIQRMIPKPQFCWCF
jgi:hypothetical protein